MPFPYYQPREPYYEKGGVNWGGALVDLVGTLAGVLEQRKKDTLEEERLRKEQEYQDAMLGLQQEQGRRAERTFAREEEPVSVPWEELEGPTETGMPLVGEREIPRYRLTDPDIMERIKTVTGAPERAQKNIMDELAAAQGNAALRGMLTEEAYRAAHEGRNPSEQIQWINAMRDRGGGGEGGNMTDEEKVWQQQIQNSMAGISELQSGLVSGTYGGPQDATYLRAKAELGRQTMALLQSMPDAAIMNDYKTRLDNAIDEMERTQLWGELATKIGHIPAQMQVFRALYVVPKPVIPSPPESQGLPPAPFNPNDPASILRALTQALSGIGQYDEWTQRRLAEKRLTGTGGSW